MLVTTAMVAVEPQEAAVALVGLDHHPVALAEPGVGAIGVDDAAVDHGRVELGRRRAAPRSSRSSWSCRGCRRPRSSICSRISSASISARRTTGTRALARGLDLGIVALDRRGDHDDRRLAEIVGAMADRDRDAELAQALDVGVLGDVRALHAGSRDCASPRRCRTCRCRRCRRSGCRPRRSAGSSCQRLPAAAGTRARQASERVGERARRIRAGRARARRARHAASCSGRVEPALRELGRRAAAAVERRPRGSAGRRRPPPAPAALAAGDRRWRGGRAPASPAGRAPAARRRSRRPSAQITRCASASRSGRSSKKVISSAGIAEPGIGGGDPLEILGPALLGQRDARAAARAGSSASAAGTTSLRTRAPWLPPITRSSSGAVGVGRR